jgi:hypothetical protein
LQGLPCGLMNIQIFHLSSSSRRRAGGWVPDFLSHRPRQD